MGSRGGIQSIEFDLLRAIDARLGIHTRAPGDPPVLRHDPQNTPLRVYARKHLWIRTKEASLVPFAFNSVQKRYDAIKRQTRMRRRPRRWIVLKYRQGGITTYEQADSYVRSLRPNSNVLTLAHDGGTTGRIFRMARLFYERDRDPPKRKSTSAFRLEYPSIHSLFFIGTAAGKGVGRSDTLQKIHWSEVAHSLQGGNQIEKQDELYSGLAEAAGENDIVLESTPKGHEFFHDVYVKAKRGENGFTPIFLPWFIDPRNRLPLEDGEAEYIVETMSEEETNLVRMHGLSPAQIKWRRSKKSELGKRFRQEHPEDDETCFLAAGDCYFDIGMLQSLLDGIPNYTLDTFNKKRDLPEGFPFVSRRSIPGGYEIIWEEPVPTEEYIVAADTSEGLPGSNPNGCAVLKRSTGEQVAVRHGRFGIREQAAHIAEVGKKYNGAMLAPERNNHGHAVIMKLEDIGCSADIYLHRDGKKGWPTGPDNRMVMLEDMAIAVENGGMEVRHREFLAECLTFNHQGSGYYGADSGAHDATLFMWAIAWQVRNVRRPSTRIRRASR